MSGLKTQPTDDPVDEFLDSIPAAAKRSDAWTLCKMMTQITGSPATMWGSGIVGFGRYHYKYASGHSGEWFVAGFAPRKTAITIYLMGGVDAHVDSLARLGK